MFGSTAPITRGRQQVSALAEEGAPGVRLAKALVR